MNIKTKVISIVIICLAIGAMINVYLTNDMYKKNIEMVATQSIEQAKGSFKNLMDNDTKMLSGVLQSLMANKEYKDAYLAKDREKLLSLTSPLFKTLKEKSGITHWYFLDTEETSKCFLRVHKPAQFDDVIPRATYKNAIQSKSYGVGLELGQTAFALRVVHPYYDNNNIIGYMETGEEIDHFFEIMKKQTGDEYGLLIKKKYLDEKAWDSVTKTKNINNNWGDMADVLLVNTTSKDPGIIKFDKDIEGISDNGVVLEEIHNENGVFVRGIFPIYDAADRKVGGVFVIHDISKIYAGMKDMQKKSIVGIFVIMLMICIVIVYMLTRLIFKRLTDMTLKATRVVGGDFHTEIKIASDDEVGKFESLFEQFRQVFVDILEQLDEKNKKQ